TAPTPDHRARPRQRRNIPRRNIRVRDVRPTTSSRFGGSHMNAKPLIVFGAAALFGTRGRAQSQAVDTATNPDVRQLVGRLDLEKYKATIKGLTLFGDRRQGTDRNRAAVDWIEAQLRAYGCSAVARLKYDYQPPSSPSPGGRGGQGVRPASGGGRYRGVRAQTGVNTDPMKQRDEKLRA